MFAAKKPSLQKPQLVVVGILAVLRLLGVLKQLLSKYELLKVLKVLLCVKDNLQVQPTVIMALTA
jgi:hypothetical protein